MLFGDERLTNFHQLLEYGCYGLLHGVPGGEPSMVWNCMATGQAPEEFERRAEPAIWDQVAKSGKRAVVVMPSNGVHKDRVAFVYPDSLVPGISEDIYALPGQRDEDDLISLENVIVEMSRRQFEVLRELIREGKWDYLQYVATGLETLQRAFMPYLGSEHQEYGHGDGLERAIAEYYLELDRELGHIFELLSEDTGVGLLSVDSRMPAVNSETDPHGFFALAGIADQPLGEIADAYLLDLAPTFLELMGNDRPASMVGKSLLQTRDSQTTLSEDDEELLRERLSGLGYVS
jgi:predicted AlkP superfamily phosphohydrolase/phosphomutase